MNLSTKGRCSSIVERPCVPIT